MSTRIWVSISPTRSMRSTRRPSIFVWRSFRGPISAPPKRRSRCTRCWTCGATSRASSTCRMASCTTFTRSTPAFAGQALLLPEAGAIYVMDRGYVDFARLHVLHLAGAFFVTRAKSNMDAHRVYSAAADRTTGIICDQTIALDGHYTTQHYPEHRASASGTPKRERSWCSSPISPGCPLPPSPRSTKAAGKVELFFKWIKQHLRIKRFFGTSENAVKTQIWIAVSVYVLVAIVKKRLALDASLYALLQIFSVTLFEKMPMYQALAQDNSKCDTAQITNQLNLFAY